MRTEGQTDIHDRKLTDGFRNSSSVPKFVPAAKTQFNFPSKTPKASVVM